MYKDAKTEFSFILSEFVEQYHLRPAVMKIACSITLFLVLTLFSTGAHAATTWYMCNSGSTCGSGWSTGSDSNAGTSKSAPFASLKGAFAKMKGGDTLIIGNGTYTGSNNTIFLPNGTLPPAGSSAAWTKIQAENNGGVLFDGQNKEQHMFYYQPGSSGSRASVYVEFQGLTWARSSDPAALGAVVGLIYARYVKFINCGAFDPLPGNSSAFNAYGCDYVLYEGCYAYGLGRYKFISYAGSQYIIYRNCVARHDSDDQRDLGWPTGIYSMYDSNHILVQNSIAIDADQPEAYRLDGTGPGQYGGCFNVFTTSAPSTDVTFTNSLCLNSKVGATFVANNNSSTNIVFKDSVFWDLETQTPTSPGNVQRQSIFQTRATSGTFTNLTFGAATDPKIGTGEDTNFGVNYGGTNNLYNSIFTNIALTPSNTPLLANWSAKDYNDFYGNTGSISTSSHDTTVNPSLKWILLSCTNNLPASWAGISGSTAMCGKGQSGSNIGANLIYQQGKSRTMWGEAGYNLQQDGTNSQTTVLMWPFPNESVIKTRMAAYNNYGVSGNRGFCAYVSPFGSPNTLTSYIWEYLGNKIPSDIYGGTSSPSAPTGLKIVSSP